MKVELYLDNPMGGSCGCSVSVSDRMALVKKVREEAQLWEKVKKTHRNHEYVRQVVADPRAIEKLPQHVSDAVNSGAELPLVFIDAGLVHSGSFPSVQEFDKLLGG